MVSGVRKVEADDVVACLCGQVASVQFQCLKGSSQRDVPSSVLTELEFSSFKFHFGFQSSAFLIVCERNIYVPAACGVSNDSPGTCLGCVGQTVGVYVYLLESRSAYGDVSAAGLQFAASAAIVRVVP